MKVCYFASEYPAVPHTFIRREIAELEANEISVFRVSLRRGLRELVDQADLDERERTRYILEQGVFEIIRTLAVSGARRPRMLLGAAIVAAKMMRRSHRPAPYHLAYLAEALVLAHWAIEQRVRHIHAHFGTNGAEVAMLMHFMTGIPYSFTVHGPDEFDSPEFLGLAEKVKHADFVCAVSSFTRSQICRWIPFADWEKIAVVKCGLDAEFLKQRRTKALSKTHIVSVGRLHRQKGQLVLLDALAALEHEGVPFRVTIAGDGPLRPELERRVCELGLVDKVVITGWLTNSQVLALITDARALVMPSFAEGLPVAIMEALATGRPVISTYVGGIPELVTDGGCGWLVPAGGVQPLARAIKECLNASDERVLAMGETGRLRVLEEHDIRRECRKLAALFLRGEVTISSRNALIGAADADSGGQRALLPWTQSACSGSAWNDTRGVSPAHVMTSVKET